MKAAVIHQFGQVPKFEDFPEPVANAGDVSVQVKAVILDYAVKALAGGGHFASRQFYPSFPAIVGRSGVGSLEDGTPVMFQILQAPYGALAERVVVPATAATPIPEGVDPIQAAVLPSAAQSSLLPLKYTAKLQAGETVLINGATSVSGMLAVKIAKALGAGRVVGTGRNAATGKLVLEAGADAFINLGLPEHELADAFQREAGGGYDVILDYLGGRPTEILLSTFIPGSIGFARKRTRFIVTGVLAGPEIRFPAQSIITSGLELYGFGATNTPENLRNRAEGIAQIWDLIRRGELYMDVARFPLKDIETAWTLEEHGKRIVITP